MIYTVENAPAIGKPVTVRVNGKIVKNCFYADTERGVVKSYGRKPRINNSRDGVVVYVNRGRVEVSPKE